MATIVADSNAGENDVCAALKRLGRGRSGHLQLARKVAEDEEVDTAHLGLGDGGRRKQVGTLARDEGGRGRGASPNTLTLTLIPTRR